MKISADQLLANVLPGIKRGTLHSMVCRRQIPHHRISARVVVFDEAEIAAWLEANHRTTGGAK